MKRSEIVEKLIAEGLSEKTLVNFSDKQLNSLAERMLAEQMNSTQNSNQPQVTANVNDPNFNQVMTKLKQSGVKNINVTEEDEIEGSKKKKKKKKPTIYDKALKDMGGEKGVIKFLEKGMKGEKKSVKKESTEVKTWVKGIVENELFHNFTSKNEIMELIQVKLNENQPAPSKPERETPVREKPSTRPEKPKRENPFEPKHTPKPKALGEEGEEGQVKHKPKMPEFMKFKNLGFKFKDQK
jgi:glutamyl/glutaminyl-tRNA synthetase